MDTKSAKRTMIIKMMNMISNFTQQMRFNVLGLNPSGWKIPMYGYMTFQGIRATVGKLEATSLKKHEAGYVWEIGAYPYEDKTEILCELALFIFWSVELSHHRVKDAFMTSFIVQSLSSNNENMVDSNQLSVIDQLYEDAKNAIQSQREAVLSDYNKSQELCGQHLATMLIRVANQLEIDGDSLWDALPFYLAAHAFHNGRPHEDIDASAYELLFEMDSTHLQEKTKNGKTTILDRYLNTWNMHHLLDGAMKKMIETDYKELTVNWQ